MTLFHVSKNTFSSILRSRTFWLLFSILIIIVFSNAFSESYSGDLEPDFALSYKDYVQLTMNICSSLLLYAFPLLAIITTVLVLYRDHGDHFFEIEKASGLHSVAYVLGRVFALILINVVLTLLYAFLDIFLYLISRGGVEGMETGEIIIETIIRILRNELFIVVPAVLWYIGITYLVGSLFKNGTISATVSIGYVIFHYVSYLMFRHRIAETYFDYFSHMPYKLRHYFHYYNTEWFEETLSMLGTTLTDAILCLLFLAGSSILCIGISCLVTFKRTI